MITYYIILYYILYNTVKPSIFGVSTVLGPALHGPRHHRQDAVALSIHGGQIRTILTASHRAGEVGYIYKTDITFITYIILYYI